MLSTHACPALPLPQSFFVILTSEIGDKTFFIGERHGPRKLSASSF